MTRADHWTELWGKDAPSPFLIVEPWVIEMEKKTLGLWNGVLIIDSVTGEKDFSHFGSCANEFEKKWDEYLASK